MTWLVERIEALLSDFDVTVHTYINTYMKKKRPYNKYLFRQKYYTKKPYTDIKQ